MKDRLPLVSVITPTFNYGRFIRDALESIFCQDYPAGSLEVIVVDDGSTDNTRDIAAEYGERLSYLYQNNSGIAAARNAGFLRARGDIVTFLDADDVWLPQRTRQVVEEFLGAPDAGIVYHDIEVIDESGNKLYRDFYRSFKYRKHCDGRLLGNVIRGDIFCGGSSFSFRKKVLGSIFPIPLDTKRGIDFYLTAVASCSTTAKYIPEILGKYRIHSQNTTSRLETNTADIAGMHEDFVTTYEKVLETISRLPLVSRSEILMLKRRSVRSKIIASVLSGKRTEGIRKIPSLFRSSSSMKEIASGIGLSSVALFLPQKFYQHLIRAFNIFRRLQ